MKNFKISPFYQMNNIIKDYKWGSRTSISTLFNIPNPENKPQAEIWMGAHPEGSSSIRVEDKTQLLSDFITQNISEVLSPQTIKTFGELPYLFKVLAAEKALSIQVHPSRAEAVQGYEKENRLGIDFTAYNRNYKDPNHKPELIYALTKYQALNGFKSYKEIIDIFNQIDIHCIKNELNIFSNNQSESGLKRFFTYILKLEGKQKKEALGELLSYAEENREKESLSQLIIKLVKQYPGDIGLFSSLMLHHIVLSPGEAMYLDARTPHAYLEGTGLEVMANSNNVLRAGLTGKYIDVDELVKCTSFKEKERNTIYLNPEKIRNILRYNIPVHDFKFNVYKSPDKENISINCAEIIFAINEPVLLSHESGDKIILQKGQSAFIPHSSNKYIITSKGKVARVYK